MSDSLPTMMRAFAVNWFGEAGSLQKLPVPNIGPNDILVRVHAAGVNPLDLKIRDGKKIVDVTSFPHALGQDAAGVVVGVGQDITSFEVDDEVYGAFWLSGAFAEYARVTVSKVLISLKPAALEFVQAAALPTPGLAAVRALKAVNVQQGEMLLVNGATGSVGSYVVQFATKLGAKVLATARKDTDGYVRKLGAAEVFDFTQGDITAGVRAAHADGIDAVIDVVSGREALEHVGTTLRPDGRLATLLHSADTEGMAKRGIHATNVDLFGTAGSLDELNPFVEAKDFTVSVERTVPLEEAAGALAAVSSGHSHGKIVLTTGG